MNKAERELNEFEKRNGIRGATDIRAHFVTSTDIALDLLSELKRALRKGPCHVTRIRGRYCSTVLFSDSPLDDVVLAEWKRLDGKVQRYNERL